MHHSFSTLVVVPYNAFCSQGCELSLIYPNVLFINSPHMDHQWCTPYQRTNTQIDISARFLSKSPVLKIYPASLAASSKSNMSYLRFFFILVLLVPTSQSLKCLRVLNINPQGVFNASLYGYSQLSLDTLNHVAYLSGQNSFDMEGNIIGSDLSSQLHQIESNIRSVFKFLEVTEENILFLRVYFVDWIPTRDLPAYQEFSSRLGVSTHFATSLVAVDALALDGLLVKVEAQIAVGKKRMKKFTCRNF